jgi:single-strand DNA-binding protein
MIYTHTIGRIGAKDCRVITGTHGTFMAVDIAVDDYSKGKQITTWVRVKSSKENHIRLAEYLTKGRMVLVEGTLTSSIWTDRNGENHIQHSIIADSIAFVNAGKAFDNGQNADAADTPATKARKAVKAEGEAPVPPADAPQDKSEDLPF